MNKAKFYDLIRPLFAGSLSQPQVDGINAILDACAKYRVTDPHHVANILANVMRETGGYMSPIKETVMPHHKNKNPSDATVIARLDRAWEKGQLKWVKTPYWRGGMFGRGPIQVTHDYNYRKMGERLGVDLLSNLNLLIDPRIGAESAVVGMAEGMFTGRKLSDYVFPRDLHNPPSKHPRRIVNGQDGSDAEIRKSHMAFYNALVAAGFDGEVKADTLIAKAVEKPALKVANFDKDLTVEPVKETPVEPSKPHWLETLFAAFLRIFKIREKK